MSCQDTIPLLNRAVADELSAIHQYMYFHFHVHDQGFRPLSTLFQKTAIREMGHLEQLAERILFLRGEVDMSASGPVLKILERVEMLSKAAEMEQESAAFYNRAAVQCGASEDSASKQLFEQLVREEERHYDEFERQMDHIKRFGPAYLALQSFSPAVASAVAADLRTE